MLMLRRLLFSRGTVGNIRATLWKAALGYLPNGSISFVCAQHNTNARTHTNTFEHAKKQHQQHKQVDCPTTWEHFHEQAEMALAKGRAEYALLAKKYRAIIEKAIRTPGTKEWGLYRELDSYLMLTLTRSIPQICADRKYQEIVGRVLYIWISESPIDIYLGLVDIAYVFLIALLGEHPDINGEYMRLIRYESSNFSPEFLLRVEADLYGLMKHFLDNALVCRLLPHTSQE